MGAHLGLRVKFHLKDKTYINTNGDVFFVRLRLRCRGAGKFLKLGERHFEQVLCASSLALLFHEFVNCLH